MGEITLKEFHMNYCTVCNTPLRVGQDSCPRHPMPQAAVAAKPVSAPKKKRATRRRAEKKDN